ncbi:MAG: hypothetical protein QOK81_04150, partial [Nitrososphaeraceae archaeon]|nr:hypothetical protein [Nitrososphaeraceae archaeon]
MNRYSSALSLAATVILVFQTSVLAYGQISSSQLFGCQEYGSSMHCDLLLNEMEASEVRGNSSLINPLTTTD